MNCRLVLLARPGAGKSTQARRLAAILGAAHLSAGELLRQEMAAATPPGLAAASAVQHGDLVSDGLMEAVIGPRLTQAAAGGGYILDGFPRDLAQAQALAALAPGQEPQAAVSLEVSAAECHRRLLARAWAEGRADDTPAVIDRRLAAYDGDMDPVLRWYEARGLLLRIDGAGDPAQVTGRILAAIRLR